MLRNHNWSLKETQQKVKTLAYLVRFCSFLFNFRGTFTASCQQLGSKQGFVLAGHNNSNYSSCQNGYYSAVDDGSGDRAISGLASINSSSIYKGNDQYFKAKICKTTSLKDCAESRARILCFSQTPKNRRHRRFRTRRRGTWSQGIKETKTWINLTK